MGFGYCRYFLWGHEHYVVAYGNDVLESILLLEKNAPNAPNDAILMPIARNAIKWIIEGNVSKTPFKLKATPFQKLVFETLNKVPQGYVTTYKEVAKAIGCGSPRAVGQALKRNSVPLFIPCHRVVANDRTLGGYSCGIALKEHLLKKEGVVILENKVEKRHVLRNL